MEEKNYPPGCIQIFEEDRIKLLEVMYEKKKELINQIQLFPVSTHVRSIKIRNEKAATEKKLEELENVIRCFEKKKVYLKK